MVQSTEIEKKIRLLVNHPWLLFLHPWKAVPILQKPKRKMMTLTPHQMSCRRLLIPWGNSEGAFGSAGKAVDVQKPYQADATRFRARWVHYCHRAQNHHQELAPHLQWTMCHCYPLCRQIPLRLQTIHHTIDPCDRSLSSDEDKRRSSPPEVACRSDRVWRKAHAKTVRPQFAMPRKV